MSQTENLAPDTTRDSNAKNVHRQQVDPERARYIKDFFWNHSQLFAKVIPGKEKAGIKFSCYFDYCQPIHLIQSHHALELLRGRREGILRLTFKLPEETTSLDPIEVTALSNLTKQEKAKLEKDLISNLREVAEKEAIALCVQNLRQKLMAVPVGKKILLALDTRFRAGIKVAIIDNTGKFLDATHLNLYPPLKDWYGSIAELAKLSIKHHVELIGIGSGPAFRETVRLVNDLIRMYPDLKLFKQVLHSTNVPPYTPSTLSEEELSYFDESFWGALSVARQLQDPIAELISIDPTTINLGPYQQDVRPAILKPALEAIIKDCTEKKASQDSLPRKNDERRTKNNGRNRNSDKASSERQARHSPAPLFNSAMADALAKLRTGEKS